MKFTHLHVHSQYSLLDGLPKIEELLDYAKSLGMESLALTDHGAIYGAVEFQKKAKEKGIKPIIGVELYLAFENMHQKRPNIDDKRYHLLLLVKNKKGYENLVKLITKAHLEGFYYKPRVDEKTLFEHSEGLIHLSGCLQGKIPRLLLAKKTQEAEKLALEYQSVFGKDNFYLELQPHPNLKEQKIANEALIELAKKTKIPLVATNDSHYLRKEDAKIQDILMLINTGADPNDPERLTLKSDDFSLKSPEEMISAFKEVPEAIENTQKIVALCNFELELGKTKLPSFPLPPNLSADDYLRKLCFEGLKKRGITETQEVKERLEKELQIIEKTGFASYFLIVQDFVNWAKQNRIVVGPGRGSVGGSLVAYLLNITEINPLKYNLLFERFLNPERAAGLPDIDLDFTDRRRDEVIDYVRQKYGAEKVAQIITFGTMAARAAIRDVGRAMQYPYSYCDKIAKIIPFGFTLKETLEKVAEFREIYENDLKAKELIETAMRLEGVARHASTHACGVVISKEPLDKLVPLQHPTQDDKAIVTQYEMHAIEDLGLLKMDFLGLKNLTIIEDTLNRIYSIHQKNIAIDKIPLDDPKTYELLAKGETTSVFQLESAGMKRYLKMLKPNSFEDIVAMVALYRPGPMQFLPEYIARKKNQKKIEYLHPKLKPILEETYGICIFQEQLMRIATDLAGFSMAEADYLRKAVGKKIKELLIEQGKKLIDGMIRNHIDKKIAEQIWNWILPFARYGFNKSHSVAYALIAYQTAYLKAHFPLEFMAAVLTSEKADVERIGFLIQECQNMGIEVLPPEINESFRNFSVVPKEKKIRFGLLAIKNVGENTVEAILKERKEHGPFLSIEDFLTRINPQDINKKSFESLIKAGVFDNFADRRQLLENVENLLDWARTFHKNKKAPQKSLFDNHPSEEKPSLKITLEKAPKTTKQEKLKWEKELLGLYISEHPLNDFRSVLKKYTLPLAQITEDLAGKFVSIGGIISKIKKILTKNGKPMLFVSVEDYSHKIEVIAFPSVLEKNYQLFQEEKIVIIKGKVDNYDGTPKIIAQEIQEIINHQSI
jgi:DNA polymerase-3 subunit alpha